ncbi:MAG: hypothetical protein DRQ51_05985 [Gammaproteobacteria bacterium]|nr:MAG: hypothetical protein DRQ51_05985 [Gammaproteobacteria bacterium]
MDKIFITDLKVKTIIGIYESERHDKQQISIDLAISFDAKSAAKTDNIQSTIDYNQISNKIHSFVSKSNFALIETLAESIAEIIILENAAKKVKVCVHKLDVVDNVRDVGVRITRKSMNLIFLSIGSNINPHKNINKAYKFLKNEFNKIRVSPEYKNPAIGFTGDDFINSVVRIKSCKSAKKVYKKIKKIEKKILKQNKNKKLTSRLIDIDILTYNQMVVKNKKFIIPRSDITKYAHVLKPLSDIAPQEIHPILQQTYKSLWKNNVKFHTQRLDLLDAFR